MESQILQSASKNSSLLPLWGQRLGAVAVLLALLGWSWQLASDQRNLALSLVLGIAFGITLQRSRFCFFCMSREYLDERDSRGLLGLIVALAIGSLGTFAIFSAILPNPGLGRLPPDAHIGPVSWVLVLAAFSFGAGMSISGSCISAHLYRLGEGSLASILALIGTIFGFVLGFLTWNQLYLGTIQSAPVVWLPQHLGYGGALALQLALLAVLAVFLMYRHQARAEPAQGSYWSQVMEQRWPSHIGGLMVAFIATIAYFRIAPLGVTAELGSLARSAGAGFSWFPARLEGLDSFAGCATIVKESILSENGIFVMGLVGAAFASALMAKQFQPKIPSMRDLLRNFAGGLLMGWGAMTALGCTVGTLLSGTMAASLSGWVFAVFCMLGLWLTWRLRQRLSN